LRIDYPRRAYSNWRRFVPSWRQWLSLVLVGVLLATTGFVALYLAVDVPEPNELSQAQSSVVYYADGKQEIGRFEEVNREMVSMGDIPEHVQHAVLAAEDRGFYDNQGISPTGIARAAWNNLTGGETQGASTITQQYARNAYLSQERTWTRKIKESILAIKIDRELSKDQILQDYLNTIYFGRGAYGVQAASQEFFRKDVSDLTVEEGAVLAALIRAPSAYDPAEGKDAKQALEGRVLEYVLPGMVEEGWLDAETAAAAEMPKIFPPQKGSDFAGPEGYILDSYVREEMQDLGFSNTEIETGGLRIVTTIEEQAQDAAEESVSANFPSVDSRGVRTGLASVEPGTGAIRAMYGGKDYLKWFNNAATARLEPGSTFKVFALAAALEDGVLLTDIFDGNSPWTDPATGDTIENQGDSGGSSFGPVSLLTATENSINTAFLDLADQIGPERVLDAAYAAGIPMKTSNLQPVPAVVLGNGNVSPVEMAAAYATFAAEGIYAEPYSVQEVRSSTGELLYEASPDTRRAFSAGVANEVTYALTQVVEQGTGTTAQALGRPAAGKTGTHELYTSWFVGYTPQLATAVMFYRDYPGNKGERPTLSGVGGLPVFYGGQYPATIWTSYMTAALDGEPVLEFPPPPAPVQTTTPTPTPTPTKTSESPSPTPTSSSPKPTKTPSETPSETPTSETPTEEEPPGGGGGRVTSG
jgi:membrane peptidoglycan carboxypeptidase